MCLIRPRAPWPPLQRVRTSLHLKACRCVAHQPPRPARRLYTSHDSKEDMRWLSTRLALVWLLADTAPAPSRVREPAGLGTGGGGVVVMGGRGGGNGYAGEQARRAVGLGAREGNPRGRRHSMPPTRFKIRGGQAPASVPLQSERSRNRFSASPHMVRCRTLPDAMRPVSSTSAPLHLRPGPNQHARPARRLDNSGPSNPNPATPAPSP